MTLRSTGAVGGGPKVGGKPGTEGGLASQSNRESVGAKEGDKAEERVLMITRERAPVGEKAEAWAKVSVCERKEERGVWRY